MEKNSFQVIDDEIRKKIVILSNLSQYYFIKRKIFSRLWVYSRVSLIVLGALAATKGTFDKFIPPDYISNVLFFTVIGLLVAIISAVETTFGYEKKKIGYTNLGLESSAIMLTVETSLAEKVWSNENLNEKRNEAIELLKMLTEKINDIQTKGVKQGL